MKADLFVFLFVLFDDHDLIWIHKPKLLSRFLLYSLWIFLQLFDFPLQLTSLLLKTFYSLKQRSLFFLGPIHFDPTVLTEEGSYEQDQKKEAQGDDEKLLAKIASVSYFLAPQDMASSPDLISLATSFLVAASP